MARSVFRLVGPGNLWERTTGDDPLTAANLAPDTTYTFDAGEGDFTVTTDPSAFTPSELFGAGESGFWFNAKDGRVWTDAAATTPATASEPVARVDDASGNGNHATQAAAGSRPAFSAANGLAFDGSGDRLSIPELTGADYTICVGAVVSASGVLFLLGSSGASVKLGALNGTWFLRSAPGGASITGGSVSVGTPYVITAIRSGGTHQIRVSGAQVASGATGAESTSWSIWGDDGAGAYWNGSSKALLGINRALSGADLTQTEAHIAALMGVTL